MGKHIRNPSRLPLRLSFFALAVLGSGLIVPSQAKAQPTSDAQFMLNQQVWTRADSSTCTGAICPAPGAAAWNQGTIGTTSQRFPIDFSIFAYQEAVGINPGNLADVRGPVAVNGLGFTPAPNTYWAYDAGGITMSGFSINGDAKLPIGLIDGGGSLGLVSGTIYGDIYVDPSTTYTPSSSVTIKGNTHNTTDPINFEMAFVKLQAMSATLSQLAPTGTVSSQWGTVKLTSTQPNANPQVFSVVGSALSYQGNPPTTSIQFVNVPAGATVVVNVSGTNPSIAFAQTSGQPAVNGILWNFYQATTVTTGSFAFMGSVLAPFAYVQMGWGSVNGTLAALAVAATSEFHWYPFHNNVLVAGP